MGTVIEAGIEPLVNALNELDFITTVYSCEGHFDRPPNEKFLPTAYVTFSTTEPEKFQQLYRRICAMKESEASVSLRMTYDCLLGLYTFSIWPDASIRDVSERRIAVDAAIRRLSDVALTSVRHPSSDSNYGEKADYHGMHPCGETPPPCMLVIPAGELMCPFPYPHEQEPEEIR